MNFDWENSVLLIESEVKENTFFGTGFALFNIKDITFVLTCHHVVEQVGGIEQLICNGKKPELVASGQEKNIDLTILKFKNLFIGTVGIRPSLYFKSSDKCIISGYHKYGEKHLLQRYINCKLGRLVSLRTPKSDNQINACDLIITDDYQLRPGYSGSPVIKEGYAVGIATFREGGDKGLMISIDAIKQFWQDEDSEIYWSKDNSINDAVPIIEKLDWYSAPELSYFFGRNQELKKLYKWVLKDSCQLLAIIGLRGVGKTNLAIKFAKDIQKDFEYLAWRSLINKQDITEIIVGLIQNISEEAVIDLPTDVHKLILYFIGKLQEKKCLIIFDNIETVLDNIEGDQNSSNLYYQLFKALSETKHNSCIILTSRIKPEIINYYEGKKLNVRALEIHGLNVENSKKIFQRIGKFTATKDEWKAIIEGYDGNPMMLKFAAGYIYSAYNGDIKQFIMNESIVLKDIKGILDWYFDRLVALEKRVLYILSIDREPLTINEIKNNIINIAEKENILETIISLKNKQLIENSYSRFSLLPVMLEYITEKFVQEIYSEITRIAPVNIHLHPILKAQSKDYIKECQKKFIIEPLRRNIESYLGNIQFISNCKKLINSIKQNIYPFPTFLGGNIINLFSLLNINLSNINFSNIKIWQADLQNLPLQGIDFSKCNFKNSSFIDKIGNVLSVKFSPDEKYILAGDDKGLLHIWESNTYSKIRTIFAHPSWIRSISFHPLGEVFATGSSDYTIKIWDLSSGNELAHLINHNDQVYSVAFSHSGNLLASSSEDGRVLLWDTENYKVLFELKESQGRVRDTKFSLDDKFLLCSSAIISVWDISLKQKTFTSDRDNTYIRTACFSSDENLLAFARNDGTISVYSKTFGEIIQVFKHPDKVWALCFNEYNNVIISGCEDGIIRFWDINANKPIQYLYGHQSAIRSIDYSSKSNILLSGGADNSIKIWSIDNLESVKTVTGFSNAIKSIFLNKSTLWAAGEDGVVRIWDLLQHEEYQYSSAGNDTIEVLSYNERDNMLAFAGRDKEVFLRHINDMSLLKLTGHSDWVWDIKFNFSFADTIISASRDNTIIIWNYKSKKKLNTLNAHTDEVHSISLSYDGEWLISGSDDNTIKIWSTENYENVRTISQDNCIRCVRFSESDYKFISCGDDNIVRLWDINNSNCLGLFYGHSARVRDAIFLSDEMIASCGDDFTIKIWDKNKNILLRTLEGHKNTVNQIIQYDDDTIISCSDDGTIKFWNFKENFCQFTLESKRPYENLKIINATGLTSGDIEVLKELGAITQ